MEEPHDCMDQGKRVFLGLLLLFAAALQRTWAFPRPRYASGLKSADCSSLDADVLVLGAGMAGITAAKTLSQDYNINNFLILEGMDDIGGRVRSVPFGGINIELGANWIEGVLGKYTPQVNPLWLLKERYGLEGTVSNYSDLVVYTQDGYRIAGNALKELVARLNETRKKVVKEADVRREMDLGDVSIRAALRLKGWEPSNAANMFLEWFAYDFILGESPDLTSLTDNVPDNNYEDFGPYEFFVTDQRGYSILIKKLAEQFLKSSDPRLHLKEAVQSIEWGDCCVCATTDVNRYCATTAIHTFSIGTLHHKTVKFVPELPEWKLRAINTCDMALYLKIFVEFPFIFWDSNQFIGYGSWGRGYFPLIQPMNLYFPENPPIVMVTVTQDEAWRISHQSEEQTTKEIWEVFQNMYGSSVTVPQPKSILVPDWVTNPFFHGMYSNYPVGLTDKYLDDMQTPLGSLVFSGEALSDYNGYLQGAYFSGIKGAADAYSFITTCMQISNHPAWTR